jgi:hypothetical protein
MSLVSAEITTERVTALSTLRRPSPHFQRSINLKYDLGDADYIAGYVPTPNAAEALVALLTATRPDAGQRAHLLHGAYGSGKSLFATVLAAILCRDEALHAALAPVLDRLRRDFPDAAEAVAVQLTAGPRLLPVVLSGDEGELSLALGRALDRTLAGMGLGDIHPYTVYRAALETLRQWRDDYPAAYDRLADWLEAREKTREGLVQALEQYQPWAYQLFLDAYPHLTAGATFDRHNGQPIVEAYRQTVDELSACGYDGIVILWDEFGRLLEARAGEPWGTDAALLQDFAETCNRSGAGQLHLILIAHKELGQYASHLPPEYQQEWERIAGRFRSLDVSGDPEVSYLLIAEALSVTDPAAWAAFLGTQKATIDRLLERIFELGLFRLMSPERIREQVLERAYPLHPLATYCLPRLSNRVAQNERTLFTFLASEEPDALGPHLARAVPGTPEAWVHLDRLWDYFAHAIRADAGTGGAHPVWVGVETALRKVAPEDSLTAHLVKALGVLTVVGDADGVRPSTEMLCFATGMEGREGRQAVEERLNYLARRKVLIFNQIENAWEFFSGSRVDLEAKLAEARETRQLQPVQRRQLLERVLPPHHYRARRFNQEYGMTRFFWSLYRAPQELAHTDWDLTLREVRVNGQRWEYADGFIVYTLPTDEAELNQARELAQAVHHAQVLIVVPRRPPLIEPLLTDWLVLDELGNDAVFKDQDPVRLQRELDFYVAETTARLERALAPLVQPSLGGADWYYQGQLLSRPPDSDARVSHLLSRICDDVFPHTPNLFNELLNKREPSAVQMRAATKVIDALFVDRLTDDLNLSGSGPDVMAVKTILKTPGILRPTEDEEWKISRPTDEALAQAWDVIDGFLHQARTEPRSFAELLSTLQSPPYGLRLGILPLLVAAAMRSYLRVATVRKSQKAIIPLKGTTFTDLCRHPDQYTVEVGAWDERQEVMWQILEERFGGRVLAEERRHQPLSYLSLGMLRWLQGQPRYARDTTCLSEKAIQLRSLINQAMSDPARTLFEDLPALLDDGSATEDDGNYRGMLNRRLGSLLDEIAAAPNELQRRLDQFAVEYFAADSPTPRWDGRSALSYWLAGVEQQAGVQVETLRFNDERAEGLVQVLRSDSDGQELFWDRLAHGLIGVSLRDWSDTSEETFKAQLLATKEQLEREALGLAEEGEVIQLQIHLPEAGERTYRFRPSDLSPQGQRILQNFKSTLEIAGRPLSPDERRQVVLALLHHVLGEEDA